MKPFKYFLRKFKYYLDGRVLINPEISISKRWYGNNYGGFYLHTEEINAQSIVYSLGIGMDVSFDMDLIASFKCNVYGFDPTPKSIQWVKENINESKFIMSEFGISNSSKKKKFYLPKNQDNISGSLFPIDTVNKGDAIMLEFKTLQEVMQNNNHNHLDILKIDIEGAEYEVLNQIINQSISINQIVVEFHPHLIRNGRRKTLEILNLLKQNGYRCFAISNSYLEYSFLKK